MNVIRIECVIKLFTVCLLIIGLPNKVFGQNNIITLDALPGGSEGNTKYTDSSPIYINNSGVASYDNSNQFDDWSVSSTTITPSGALDKTFQLLFGGISSVNTSEGVDYGGVNTPGGIDRASAGDLGVRGGTNGIDKEEGFFFGLNLSAVDYTASLQFTKIYVSFAGNTGETGVVVNRKNPSNSITFGNASGVNQSVTTNNETAIDISSLNIYLTGTRTDNDMLSIFNTSSVANSFRVTKVELKVVTNILNAAVVEGKSHPRLLMQDSETSKITTLINNSTPFEGLHNHIIQEANSFLNASNITMPSSGRFMNEARAALKQIFFLSYAYRMTGASSYLTKAESVINTVSDLAWEIPNSQDLEQAEMCMAVSIGYDWLYNNLSNATKQKARTAISDKGLQNLLSPRFDFWNATSNWNQVCIAGAAYGALAIYKDGTTTMDNRAKEVFRRIIAKNVFPMEKAYADGNYAEGPMYWSYGTTFEVMLLSALEKIYGANHPDIKRLTASPGFLKSAEYMQYVTGPTNLYFNYMDSTVKRSPLPAVFWMSDKLNQISYLSEEMKLLSDGTYFINNVESRLLPLTLIYAKEFTASGLNNIASPTDKLWYGYGEQPVAMVRTSFEGATGKYFGVKGGTSDYSHGHMDGGNFVYDSQGMRWGMDFGKYDYGGVSTGIAARGGNHSDKSQNSLRWDIFKASNLNHNTVSIKKSSESEWQRHKSSGYATINEIYDTSAKRGVKIDLKDVIGLNNELSAISRSMYLVNEDYLEIKDEINTNTESVDVYWNMATTALVEVVNSSQLKLTQGGKTVIMEVTSSNANVSFTLEHNRSTDPVDYFPIATYERKNPGTRMIGFTSTIPANQNVTYTVTLKDGAEVPASTTIAVNEILLELPNPNTGREGNSFYSDASNFYIDADGDVDITGISSENAWKVYGGSDLNNAKSSYFKFSWDAMGTTNTNAGNDYGALLTPAGIDRASRGDLGVRGGTNGVDINEGYRLGFDLKRLPSSVSLQLLKVGLDFIGGNESGVIVNRNDTSKQKTFGASGVSADVNLSRGFVDVEDLDIIVQGGNLDTDMASVFNTSASSGSYRVTKFIFKMLSTNTLSAKLNTEKSEILDNEILVYPNPLKDYVFVKSVKETQKALKVNIYNVLGASVLSRVVESNERVDLGRLTKGVYLIMITNGEHTVTKKIIKD